MLSFEDVLHVSLAGLGRAVEDWAAQVRRLEEMRGRALDMAGQARSVAWPGGSAAVTVPYVEEQSGQFEAALEQARTLCGICRDGYTRLKRCQDELRTVVDVSAPASGVRVGRRGEVSADPGGPGRPAAVADIAARIGDILRRAAWEDRTIARALRDAMGPDPAAFNPVRYDSLDAALRAYRDARAVVGLARRDGRPPDERLARMAALLARHEGDPVFAERVATGLGAWGVVEFWTAVGRAPGGRGRRRGRPWRLRASLQTRLGELLGTATRCGSAAMETWEREMVGMGAAGRPRGFQVMSALMRPGRYGAGFLLDYGDAVLDHEQGRPGDSPSRVWDAGPALVFDFLADGDPGHDPVPGFLAALARDPAAAAEFFAPPALNDRVAYLMTGRGRARDNSTRACLDSALRAAATGARPHGDTSAG